MHGNLLVNLRHQSDKFDWVFRHLHQNATSALILCPSREGVLQTLMVLRPKFPKMAALLFDPDHLSASYHFRQVKPQVVVMRARDFQRLMGVDTGFRQFVQATSHCVLQESDLLVAAEVGPETLPQKAQRIYLCAQKSPALEAHLETLPSLTTIEAEPTKIPLVIRQLGTHSCLTYLHNLLKKHTKCLIFCPTSYLADYFYRVFKDRGSVRSLHEGMKEGERWQTLQEFIGSQQGLLFTTYALCGRGLPFPGLSKVVGLGGSTGREALEGLDRQRAPAELILFQGLDDGLLLDLEGLRQVELVETSSEAPPFLLAEDFYWHPKHRLNWKRSLQSLVQAYENRYARKLRATEKELVGRLFHGYPPSL